MAEEVTLKPDIDMIELFLALGLAEIEGLRKQEVEEADTCRTVEPQEEEERRRGRHDSVANAGDASD